jgi:hypothetical protein
MPFYCHWWSQIDCTLCNPLDCARPASFPRTELVRQILCALVSMSRMSLHSLGSPSPGLASYVFVLLRLASSERFMFASSASSRLHPRVILVHLRFILASSFCISLQRSSLHLASPLFILSPSSLHSLSILFILSAS